MKRWTFAPLDWVMAWRHIRVGDERPGWVGALLVGSIYLIVLGLGFAWYAASLGGPEISAVDAQGFAVEMGPTPEQRYFGAFGGLTLMVGVMALLFGLLAYTFNLLATIITMSVLLGCMALVVVLSLMSGLEGDLRDKILSQKAHIRVSRGDARPFGNYLEVADTIAGGEGIAGASPYLEGEIMVRSGLQRQAAIMSGILPDRQQQVSNLHELVQEGSYDHLRHPELIPDPDPFSIGGDTPWRLRHLEDHRKRSKSVKQRQEFREEDQAATRESSDRKEMTEVGKVVTRLPPPPLGEGWEDPEEFTPPDPGPPEGWEDPESELNLPPVDEDREGKVAPEEDDARGPGAAMIEGPSEGGRPEAHEAVPNPVLIGRELAVELGVGVGAQVQLITPIGRMTPAGRIPGVMASEVGGVFFSGMYEYDRKNVYVPLGVAQAFLRVGDQVTGIEIKVDDVDDMDGGKAAVQAAVDRLGLGDEFLVEDWRDLNRNLFSAMFLEKVAMFIALMFVVLVASFGILASNLMSVMEKSKEIAILKAMGTSDEQILRVFTAEGLCVGLLGGIGGISMGLGLCWALDRFGLPLEESVYYIERLPVVVNPFEVALVGIAALAIVWVSSLYPARVASRMQPVDGLRQAER